MRLLKIILYFSVFLNSSLLFSQVTVSHWMMGAQGSSQENKGNYYVYQSIGQITVTNTGTAKDFVQQGFQQSNWGSIIAQNTDTLNTNIYPNPFTDFVSVKFSSSPGKTVTCEVYDLQGRLVLAQKAEILNNSLRLDFRKLINSQFLLRIVGENYVYSQMIIKK